MTEAENIKKNGREAEKEAGEEEERKKEKNI